MGPSIAMLDWKNVNVNGSNQTGLCDDQYIQLSTLEQFKHIDIRNSNYGQT